ncbi:hypothetical protein WN943_001344 [Citrus x changshan-huyou]
MTATPNKQFKNICVLSGFNYGKHKEFIEAAIDLGRSIAETKLHLVYGGGNQGLSKLVSEAAFGHRSHFTINERSDGKTDITFELKTVENLRRSIKRKMALFTCTTVDGDVAAYQWTKNLAYGTCITQDYFQPNRVTVHPGQTALLFIQIHALTSTLKFAQQVFGAVAGEDRARSWLNTLPANSISSWEQMVTKFLNKYFPVHKTNAIRKEISEFTQREDEQFFETWERFNGLLLKCPHHGYEKWHQCQYFLEGLLPNVQEWLKATSGGELMSKSALEIWEFFQRQVDNSQQRSRSLRNTRRIKGVNEVQIGESTSGIKEVKEMVEGLARQIASLSTAKSTEPHDHDSYSDQVNAIGVMRKPSNYNPYSNTYNPGWRDHPNFSWSQGFQQNGPAAPAPPMQPIPQNLKNLTHSTIEQQNRTIDGLRNELRADFNSQAQSVSSLEKIVGQLASSV